MFTKAVFIERNNGRKEVLLDTEIHKLDLVQEKIRYAVNWLLKEEEVAFFKSSDSAETIDEISKKIEMVRQEKERWEKCKEKFDISKYRLKNKNNKRRYR